MLKHIFGTRRTTKADIVISIGAAVFAVIKAVDTIHEFKSQDKNDINKENSK